MTHEIENLELLVANIWPEVRRNFLYPALPAPECVEHDGSVPSLLVGHKVVVDLKFISRICSLGVRPEVVVTAALARSVNWFMRIPRDFGELLRMYAAIRETVLDPDLARKYLETYLTVWGDLDLSLNRDLREALVQLYQASVSRTKPEENDDFYRLIVSVIQQKLGIDLGLKHDLFWATIADELSRLEYLGNADHEREVKEFGTTLQRAGFRLKKKAPQTEDGPTLWPVVGQPVLGGTDIGMGIIEFGDLSKALVYLDELTRSGNITGSCLFQSRWFYYDHLARTLGLRVEPRFLPTPEGRAYPLTLRHWEPEDGFQRLAPLASFGGRIGIPGLTKRWLISGPETQYFEPTYPVLIVVIDSSGSMTNANTERSNAVLAAVAAANVYLDRGQPVGVYNFSSSDLILTPTLDRASVFRYICAYQGGGTTLNIEVLDRLLGQVKGSSVDILVLTDLGICNFNEALSKLKACSNLHRVFLISVGDGAAELEKARVALGSKVVCAQVNREEDIANLVLGIVEDSLASVEVMGNGDQPSS